MAKKPVHLFIDQYNQVVFARTLAELRAKCGGGKVSKMYRDRPGDNGPLHVGYVVGHRWFSRFAPVEKDA